MLLTFNNYLKKSKDSFLSLEGQGLNSHRLKRFIIQSSHTNCVIKLSTSTTSLTAVRIRDKDLISLASISAFFIPFCSSAFHVRIV